MNLTKTQVIKIIEIIARNVWLITDKSKLSFGQERILKNIIEEILEMNEE